MNTDDKSNKYTITQVQVDETIELLTTSLRHIPSFSMQLRADMRDTIMALRNLAVLESENMYASESYMTVTG